MLPVEAYFYLFCFVSYFTDIPGYLIKVINAERN